MGEWWLFLLRWLHLLAGITWIGLLYYFNFVQTPFFAKADPPVRVGMVTGGLLANALWWFRWGAMVTFITGWLYLLHRFGQMGGFPGFFGSDYGWKIFFGGMLGSLMWFNVWFIIWPNQKRALGIVAASDEAKAKSASMAMMASRTNLILSLPMLYCMIGQAHIG